MNQHQQVILHLSLIPGIGPVTIQKLLTFFTETHCSVTDLYRWSLSQFCSLGFSQRLAQICIDGLQNSQILAQELDLLEKHSINITTFFSDDYPEFLKNIYMPPSVLYYKGLSLNSSVKNLAIVGSRNGNYYAQSFIDLVMPTLGEYHWSIVSGGATGVDTIAHKSALKNNMHTISVLGSGLLVPYPYENKKLFEQIAEKGTIVSPFPLKTQPTRGNFPARNRIIAGLSRGVLIVQAGNRSGAHITARYALDQGKEIFAVPGDFDDPLSVGCHKLIQDGAKLVTDANDILKEFGEIVCDINQSPESAVAVETDPIRRTILQVCQKAVSVDDIVDQVHLSADEVYAHLFDLQVKGLIEQNFMGLFQITLSK